MLKICKQNKNKVKAQIQENVLDGIVSCDSNLIDDIILAMSHEGVLDCLDNGFQDKRKHNSTIPLKFIMSLAIAAKMKTKTSLTDIPFAITSHKTIAELGYNAMNTNCDNGWFNEGTLRHLIGKYNSEEIFNYYNEIVQKNIIPKLDIQSNIHILDCTKIAVEINNTNYENSSITRDRKGNSMRGYKLSSLRGLYGDTGIIEDVRFGTASTHDVALSKEMLLTTDCFHEGDILIMDRGFLSRTLINQLKMDRKIDVYIPMKKNMDITRLAIEIANSECDWKPHPTRGDQVIAFVSDLGEYWESDDKSKDVDINACVVWDEEESEYFVFTTTDTSKNAKEIIMTYQLRPEIEEDFRQLKEFWKLEGFKSTKYDVISFHLVCVLFGYLFYQLYLNTKDGEQYIGKCLPVILKNYKTQFTNYLAIFSGEYFCVMTIGELYRFMNECDKEIQEVILKFL